MSVQGQQQGQQEVSLSDFLLSQRRMMDQIVTNYENNLVQFAQANEQLAKRVQELEAATAAAPNIVEGSDS